ncbi:TraB/GumN family protein [uncultured Methanobrevibacter sp.]|uniref:TraB/GumN family protein n=1 Tax=uncultured Methanobrevibacter sp. TaxID=253161 RepID=UPI002638DAE3
MEERMFWRIRGYNSSGKKFTVYIQGTIHVGDERLYPLEKNVLKAFHSSSTLISELSGEDLKMFSDEIRERTTGSFSKAAGRTVTKNLSAAEKEKLRLILDDETIDFLTLLEPWCMIMALCSSPQVQSKLSPDFSLDEYFSKLAVEEKKDVLGLETLEEQLDSISGGTYDEQLSQLKEILSGIDALAFKQEMNSASMDLYEAYLACDMEKMRELTTEDERNKKWAERLLSYFETGGTFFVFAGCAHFVSENSVFDYLEDWGAVRQCSTVVRQSLPTELQDSGSK